MFRKFIEVDCYLCTITENGNIVLSEPYLTERLIINIDTIRTAHCQNINNKDRTVIYVRDNPNPICLTIEYKEFRKLITNCCGVIYMTPVEINSED